MVVTSVSAVSLSLLLAIAHDTPMAAHVGVGKTHRRVLQHFYWPRISRDVKQYCRSCRVCQSVNWKA